MEFFKVCVSSKCTQCVVLVCNFHSPSYVALICVYFVLFLDWFFSLSFPSLPVNKLMLTNEKDSDGLTDKLENLFRS